MSKKVDVPTPFCDTPAGKLLEIARRRTMDLLYNDLYDALQDTYNGYNGWDEPDYSSAKSAITTYESRMKEFEELEKQLKEQYDKEFENELHA